MTTSRKLLSGLIASLALAAGTATPASAVVGGHDASPGEYPAVAKITYGAFQCTGTLIDPSTVLTAGHCSSLTGAAVATPASYPAPLIDVEIGATKEGDGTADNPAVAKVIMEPNYLIGSGYDISLLKLSRPSTKAPVKVAGAGERSLWSAGTLETIAGWGVTQENGDASDHAAGGQRPDHLRRHVRRGLQRLRRQDDGLRRLPAGRHRHLPGRLGRAAVRPCRGRLAARRRRDELRQRVRPGRLPRRVLAGGQRDVARVDPLRRRPPPSTDPSLRSI